MLWPYGLPFPNPRFTHATRFAGQVPGLVRKHVPDQMGKLWFGLKT
jgi:hypothetical protein